MRIRTSPRPPESRFPVAGLLLALALASFAADASAQVLAQATPSQYDLELRPGQRESRPLFIQNLGRESVKVHLRIADLRMGGRGALELGPPGTLPHSLQAFVRLEPRDLEIGPGERGAVRLEMTMPVDGPATRYGVVLSRVTPAKGNETAAQPAELGTTLFLTRAPRSSLRSELAGLEARVGPAGRLAVDVRVRNRSERHAPCSGEITVTDSTGTTVSRGHIADGVVLPGATRTFGWESPRRIPVGRYTVTVTLDAGEPALLVGQADAVVGRRGPHAARDETR